MAGFSESRIREILAGRRAFREIVFPGTDDVRVAVRCLSEVEIDGARIDAQERLRSLSKKRGWTAVEAADLDPELLNRLVERALVLRAFFDPETVSLDEPVPFFESWSEIESLTSVQLRELFAAYIEHQAWTNPGSSLSEEEIEELLDRLGKAQAPEVYLGAFERNTLARFVISLARRVRSTSPTGR